MTLAQLIADAEDGICDHWDAHYCDVNGDPICADCLSLTDGNPDNPNRHHH